MHVPPTWSSQRSGLFLEITETMLALEVFSTALTAAGLGTDPVLASIRTDMINLLKNDLLVQLKAT